MQALKSSLLLLCVCSCFRPAMADDVVSRKGLDPGQNVKVTSALARARLMSGGQATGGAASSFHGMPSAGGMGKNCNTSIGNVDLGKQRPGVQAPKENIVVIKGTVVNGC